MPTLAIALGTGIPATANASSDGQQARSLKGLTCMPKPSACGFPDATNTGVPPGTPLTVVNGTVTLSTDGQVFSNRDVRGSIVVTGDNVTIEKVRVTGRSEVPLIYTRGGSAVIRDVEVNMSGEEAGKGIAFDNYTAQRVWFHNGLDCAHQGRNVTITDSYCDLPRLSQGSSAHADGFQSDGGGNYVFRHNTIRNPNEQTSAILMSTNTSPISNVVIDHNLMSGGGYTVYCGTDEGGMTPNLTYTNNVISREFFPKGGYWGATTWCDRAARSGNNVLDGNYVPPPGTVLPGSSPPAAAPGARRGRRPSAQGPRQAQDPRGTAPRAREEPGPVRERAAHEVQAPRRRPRRLPRELATGQEGPREAPLQRQGRAAPRQRQSRALPAARPPLVALVRLRPRDQALGNRLSSGAAEAGYVQPPRRATTRRRWFSRIRRVTLGCGHCGARDTAAAANPQTIARAAKFSRAR